MPIKVTVNVTRPSILVPRFHHPREVAVRRQEYIDDGRLSETITSSNDGLTEIIEKVWASEEAYNQAQSDTVLQQSAESRSKYAEANGIVWTVTTSTY